jgi:hypothetical protein
VKAKAPCKSGRFYFAAALSKDYYFNEKAMTGLPCSTLSIKDGSLEALRFPVLQPGTRPPCEATSFRLAQSNAPTVHAIDSEELPLLEKCKLMKQHGRFHIHAAVIVAHLDLLEGGVNAGQPSVLRADIAASRCQADRLNLAVCCNLLCKHLPNLGCRSPIRKRSFPFSVRMPAIGRLPPFNYYH